MTFKSPNPARRAVLAVSICFVALLALITGGVSASKKSSPGIPNSASATAPVKTARFEPDAALLVPFANDFSISASNAIVQKGQSASSSISTALVSGGAETINLSVSGVPANVTTSFNPVSSLTGFSSILTINVASNAVPGTYTLTVTGTAPSATHSATFTLIVLATPPALTSQVYFRLNNGQFGEILLGDINLDGTARHTIYYGGGNTSSVPPDTSGPGNETCVAVDTAAGLVFSVGIGKSTNPAQNSYDAFSVHNLNTGALIETIEFGPNTGSAATDDIVQAVAVNPTTHTVYVGDWGTDLAHTGVAVFTYNTSTGILTPSSSGTSSTQITTTIGGSSSTSTASGIYLFTESQVSGYTNTNAFYLDRQNNKLYYVNDDSGYNLAPYSPTNGVYVVNTTGPSFTATQLTSNGSGTGQFPPANQSLTGHDKFIGPNGSLVGLTVDVADGIVFFESTDNTGSPNNALWWVNASGANQTATKITLPAGVTLDFAGQTNEGGLAAGLSFDPSLKQLYLTDAENSASAPNLGHLYVLQWNNASKTVSLVTAFDTATLVGKSAATIASEDGISANTIDLLPTLSTSGTSTHAAEQGANVTLLTSNTITDVDGDHLASATVQITGGTFSSNETSANDDHLTIDPAHRGGGSTATAGTISGTSISYSYTSGTELLTLSGYDTVTNYQTALSFVQYFTTGDNPTNYGNNNARTITWKANDGAIGDPSGTNTTTTTLNIDAVNDPPVAGAAGNTVSYTEQQAATLAVDSGFTVSDPDNLNLAGATVQVTSGGFTGDGDKLAVNGVSNGSIAIGANTVTISYDSTTETITLSGTDTLSHYQTLLQEVQFRSTSDDPDNAGANPTRTVTWTLNDGSASSNLSTAVTSTVNITAVNDAPDLTPNSPSAVSYTENAGPTALLAGAAVSDPDNPANFSGGGFEAKVTGGAVAGDQIALLASSGFTISGSSLKNASNNSLATITGNSTADVVLSNFTSLVTPAVAGQISQAFGFQSTSDDPTSADRTVTFIFSDGGNRGTGGALTDSVTQTVHVTPVNDPPTLTATGAITNYIENAGGVTFYSSTNVSAVEAADKIKQLVLTVAGIADGANEVLHIDGSDVALTNGNSLTTATNGLSASVAVAGSTATVTLSKVAGVTPSTIATVVNAMTYADNGDNPTAGVRTITLTSIQDNGGTANGGTDTKSLNVPATVTVVPVNDAPAFTGSAGAGYTEGGSPAQVATGVSASDVDSDNYNNGSLTAAITANPQTGDSLAIANTGGISVSGVNVSYDPGSGAVVIGTISANTGTSITVSLNANANDAAVVALAQAYTFSNSTQDPTNTSRTVTLTLVDGGGTANGGQDTRNFSVSVAVTGINNAPTVSAPASYTGSPSTPFAINNITVGDVDSEGSTELMTFTIPSGAFTSSSSGGVTVGGSGTGTLTASGTISNLNSFISANKITFTGTQSATLNVSIDDQGHTPAPAKSSNTNVPITICVASTVVTNTNDSGAGSLRQALLDTCDGGTITFDTAAGHAFDPATAPHTITLTTGELAIARNLTITGPGANVLTVSGNNTSRVFNISSGTNFISNLLMTNANAAGTGGGVLNAGTLTLAGVSISGNTAQNGAAIYNNAGTLAIVNSTINGNAGNSDGGAVNNNGGTLTLTNSTISGNMSAAGTGGGIYQNGGTLTLANCTVSGNSSQSLGGGGIFNAAGAANLRNTIVAGNTISAGTGPDVNGTFTSQGHNFIGKSDDSTGFIDGSSGDQAGTIAAPKDPQLGSLANNGGPTETMALLSGSLAIDAGTDLTTLNGGIDNLTTSVIVNDASSIPAGVGFLIQIDNERMSVTSKSTNTLTVGRAQNGTIAASHNDGAAVNPAFDQRGSGFPRKLAGAGTTAVDIGAFEVEPPTAVNDGYSTHEDTPLSVNAASGVLANDTGAGTKTASLITGPSNAASFTLNSDGSFDYTPAANFNGPDSFVYSVSDSGGGSANATATITVNSVSDAPVTSNNTVTVLEDQSHTFQAADFPFADTADNPPNTLLNVIVASAPAVGTLSDNGTPITSGNVPFAVSAADVAGGKLTFAPAANGNGTPYATFNFEVQDNGGTANGGVDISTVSTMTINVTAVNDPPSFTKGADQTVLEDAGVQTVNNWATNISAGPANENGQTLTFHVTNNTNTGLFSAQPAVDASGNLIYTPAADANGSATITLTLQDDGGTANGGSDTSAPQTFVVNVTAVNDPPSFTKGADQTVNEDAGAQTVSNWATSISAGPSDESAQTLTFHVTNNTNTALFSVQPAVSSTGTLTYTPAANAFGSATITLTLQDNGGTANSGNDTSLPQTFTIAVNAVADTPSATNSTTLEDTQSTSGLVISRNANDGNEVTHFKITNIQHGTLFQNNGSTQINAGDFITFAEGNAGLRFTPATDFNNSMGTASFDVQAATGNTNAGLGGGVVTATISVTPVNDSPVFTKGADQAVNINPGAQTVNGWATGIAPGPATATDESGQALNFIVTNDNNALFSAQPAVSSSGDLTYTPANNANGSATVSVKLHDNGGGVAPNVDTSTIQTFTITVNCGASDVVTNTNDSGAGSLRDAIATACAGDTITFNLAAGPQTITLGSTLTISKTLTINGPSNQAVTINGGGNRLWSVTGGSPSFSSLTFSGALVSGGNGGGLLNSSSGTITLTGVTFTGNSADNGGAIATTAGTIVINNSTISGNTGTTDGGGIYNNGGTVSLLNDTITNNTASAGQGGGVRSVAGTINVKNTIIAGNAASSNANVAGTITDQGNNLLSGNPMLVGLANNGGPTMTHLPLPGSPAVNAGDNTAAAALSTDQRGAGFNRIVNTTVDIGAVEVNYSITVTAGSSQSAVINGAFATALQVAVQESGNNQSGLGVTFTPPASGAGGIFTGGNPATASTNGSGVATAPTFTANGTTGSYNVVASLSGGSPSVNFALTNTAANQTITVNTHAPANATFNTNFTVAATATSGLPVNYSSAGSCANVGATFTITSGTGTCSVIYNQPGNGNFNAAAPVTETVSAQKANQTITFNGITNKTFGDADFSVSPTASSGLSVGLSPSGNCTVITPAPGTVHITGAGSCTITASQAGDGNYNAAANAPQSFTIAKANQTITFGSLANRTFGDADFTVSAASSSNLTVSFTASGNCTISTNTVHITAAGSCTVTAKQAGDTNFNAATDVPQGFMIGQATTTTAASSSSNPSNLSQSVTFTATVSGPSGTGTPTGTVTFKDGVAAISCANAGGQTLNGSGVATCQTSALTAGAHTITTVYGGDTNFQPSTGTLSPNQVVNNLPLVSFSSTNYNVNESDGVVHVVVTRTGDITVPFNVDYATNDTGASTDCGALNTGLASSRCDFDTVLGTLKFAANQTQTTIDITITQDGRAEGPETFTVSLSNPTAGALLFNPASATVTINDSASPTANAIDDTTTFVRQQYHDFLNREPDAAGLAFWKQNIDKCNDPTQIPPGQTVAQCLETQRIITSAAFFLSIEFMQTGTFVRSFYVAALDRPATINMPAFAEWLRDTQAVQRGIIVGQGNWQATLDANRLAFMQDFVMRPEFVALYPTTDTPTQYINKLYSHALSRSPSSTELSDGLSVFGGASTANDPTARGQSLLKVTQASDFVSREIPRAFVQFEYFGYLRRNPNDPPDNNFNGDNFWLNKLIQFNGDFLKAEMVKAFLNSSEYRSRFGP